MWGKLCRVCSSPANYSIFAKIPSYLHQNPNEFLHWQKPINQMLEETTGLKIHKEDGLPAFMCAVCISYLKHAIVFREQTLNNAMALKAITELYNAQQQPALRQAGAHNSMHKDKTSLLITADDLMYSQMRGREANLRLNERNVQNKVQKEMLSFFQNGKRACNCANNKQRQQEQTPRSMRPPQQRQQAHTPQRERAAAAAMAELVNDDESSDDEQEEEEEELNISQKQPLFNYQEKCFEEDDVAELSTLKHLLQIDLPAETCKERKCRACSRRFMFEDSYNEHIDNCIEYKFVLMVEEVNRLWDMRVKKLMSPHEFIRRMIFCLRKTCEWLNANCGETLAPPLLQTDVSNGSSNNAATQLEEACGAAAQLNDNGELANGIAGLQAASDVGFVSDFSTNTLDSTLLNLDATLLQVETLNEMPLISPEPTRPISMANNILYEIERSESRNQQLLNETLASESSKQATPIEDLERLDFLDKLQRAVTEHKLAVAEPKQKLDTEVNAEANVEDLDSTEELTPQKRRNRRRRGRHGRTALAAEASIAVRQDLMPINEVVQPFDTMPQQICAALDEQTQMTPQKTPILLTKLMETTALQNVGLITSPGQQPSRTFTARCNVCVLVFATLAELEEHNGLFHNASLLGVKPPPLPQQQQQLQPEQLQHMKERQSIIAMFENESSDEE